MGIKFATSEWATALMEKINASEAYQKSSATWEGDIYFEVSDHSRFIYLDLWHGECRSASVHDDMSHKKAAFVITAPYKTWMSVVQGKLDPIKGIMSRQLKLKGNMLKVMKAPQAAIDLVGCTGQLETDWEID